MLELIWVFFLSLTHGNLRSEPGLGLSWLVLESTYNNNNNIISIYLSHYSNNIVDLHIRTSGDSLFFSHILIQLEEHCSSSLSFFSSHHNNNHIYFITINITTFIFIIVSPASRCGIALPPGCWLSK